MDAKNANELPSAMALSSQPQAARLKELYTDHVVPDAILKYVGSSPVERADPEWAKYFVSTLLKPDDHPTLTRFWHSADASTDS